MERREGKMRGRGERKEKRNGKVAFTLKFPNPAPWLYIQTGEKLFVRFSGYFHCTVRQRCLVSAQRCDRRMERTAAGMLRMRRLLKALRRRNQDDDRNWRRQHVSDSPPYDYINLQNTGKLVDVFEAHSGDPRQRSEALDDIIRREIARFLYDGGNGRVVRSKRNAFAPPAGVHFENVLDENTVRKHLSVCSSVTTLVFCKLMC